MEKQVEEAANKKEEVLDILADFTDAVEAAAFQLNQAIAKIMKAPLETIFEEPFLGLKWERKEGAKLKEYESTSKVINDGNDAFYHCFNVLNANKASISNRFHCDGWKHSYWLYLNNPEVIYRQPLKPKA